LNFLNTFSKNIHIPNSIKIHPVGAELFYADRGTDSVTFHNLANMCKKELYLKKSVPWSCWYRAVGWSTLGATTWAVCRALVDLMCNYGIN